MRQILISLQKMFSFLFHFNSWKVETAFAELSQVVPGLGCLCLATAPSDSERLEKKRPLSAFLLLQILSPTPCAAAVVKIRAAIIFC